MPRDDPVERRADRRVVEIDLGVSMAAFAFSTSAAAWSAFDFHSCTVAWLAKSCFAQLRLTSVFGLVVGERRLVGGKRRVRLIELRLIGVALDAEQLVALLDRGAVDIVDRRSGTPARGRRDRPT